MIEVKNKEEQGKELGEKQNKEIKECLDRDLKIMHLVDIYRKS